MIAEIPFPSILDELSLWADYTHREFHNQKALRIYNKAIRLEKQELAKRIILKYGKGISRSSRSDIAMAAFICLKVQQL